MPPPPAVAGPAPISAGFSLSSPTFHLTGQRTQSLRSDFPFFRFYHFIALSKCLYFLGHSILCFCNMLYSSGFCFVFKWNCLVCFPLQEVRWGCGMPGISPGSIGNSRSLPLGKGPDMNLLLRQRLSHCFQLWLLLRSSVQSIICVSGGQRKRHIHTKKYVWRLTYICK